MQPKTKMLISCAADPTLCFGNIYISFSGKYMYSFSRFSFLILLNFFAISDLVHRSAGEMKLISVCGSRSDLPQFVGQGQFLFPLSSSYHLCDLVSRHPSLDVTVQRL